MPLVDAGVGAAEAAAVGAGVAWRLVVPLVDDVDVPLVEVALVVVVTAAVVTSALPPE